jgi:autotransporter strand-loop-strand O-heptosyltransferase
MSNMYKSIAFHGTLNERTGYGIHATNFVRELRKLIPVNVDGDGDVHITLTDSVSIQNINSRLPYPSILYNVWESTEEPQWFMDRLKYFDQLWTASEWQRSCLIAQGVPEEFVKVVPEGVDPEIYKPADNNVLRSPWSADAPFTFVHVGQWQPRKSTIEIIQAFLRAFPATCVDGTPYQNVRLELSVDTLFPSDNYKSTEERLKAYGLEDPRISVIHFEERDSYIRRLQSAHCFVSCSRSEGWGLPIIEAMAVGIPTIVADFGGSTEYAYDAIRVNVPQLKKPTGIYGDWDVPGQWGEPDYEDLTKKMQEVFHQDYPLKKKKALETAEVIRTKFSWAAAAQKALDVIQSIPSLMPAAITPEDKIRAYARELGYEITALTQKKVMFLVDSHPDSDEKLATLLETVKQIKAFGYPIALVSHIPLPPEIEKLCEFSVYDAKDINSGDDKPTYWRRKADGTTETTQAGIPCHALAWMHNIRNGIALCKGRYDWIYQMSSDVEVDLAEWLKKVQASKASLVACRWETQPETLSGQLIAAKTEILDALYPDLSTWEEFAKMYGDDRFCCERGQYKRLFTSLPKGTEIEFVDVPLGNRFSQVDPYAWKEDLFQCHFIDGPYLNIAGNSGKEYDVAFTTPDGKGDFILKQKSGMWARPTVKYFSEWLITASIDGKEVFRHPFDLTGRNVIISLCSKALGDTLAWVPYLEEFRTKNKCEIYVSTWWANILDYPNIHFIAPGSRVENVYASYEVGCFDNQLDKNVINWRLSPLQKVAADILGVEYKPLRAKLKVEVKQKETKPYICFSEFSTMQNKFWNRPGAWQEIINYLNDLGYDCISISAEPTNLTGVIKHNGQSIEQTIADVSGAKFYVGLNHGPAWIAYSLGIPTIMITGVSEPWNDFPTPYRISVDSCRPGCFNDPTLEINRGWDWCPRGKDFVCTRDITENMIIDTILRLREDIRDGGR